MSVRVRLLTRLAGPEGNHGPGELVAVSDEAAQELVAGGYAVVVQSLGADPPAETAVRAAPEQATAGPQRKRSQRTGRGRGG